MAAAYSSYMVDYYMWGFESFLFPISKALQLYRQHSCSLWLSYCVSFIVCLYCVIMYFILANKDNRAMDTLFFGLVF